MRTEELNVSKATLDWVNENGKLLITKYIRDPHGILGTNTGKKKGVYAASVLTPEGKKLLMYVGETGKEGRCLKDRFVEHARLWIESPERYTGLKKEELESGEYTYIFELLYEEANDEKRYLLEQTTCEQSNPFLQSGVYPKFSSEYRGFDLCIHPAYRRRAFLCAKDGKYSEEKSVELLDMLKKIEGDLRRYQKFAPSDVTVERVQKEFPKGSEVYIMVKELIEKKLGIVSKRGCTYPFVIRIVSAVLEEGGKEYGRV